jgi:DNA helicase-2/ATP-dependent DNA helicase PcrA
VELDQYQKKAYLTKEKKVLVVAPPGSGKTTVMLKRLSHILEEGIPGDQVVVLTFSKASAVEMEQRFVHTSKNKPFFGTIHGLCYKILRERQGKLDMIFGKEEFLIRNRMQRELKIDQTDVDSLFRDISKYKVHTYLDEGTITLTHRDELFKKAYDLYEEERIKKGLLDFDDLQIEVLKEFSKPEVLEEFKKKHTHILIDEFQDLDPIQLKLIQKISQDQLLFCVGDEDQCIYAFRGSDPKGMIDFETMFKGKKLYLKYNYRSTENIVNYAGDVISKNALRNDKELLASRKEQRKIIKIFPENQEMMLYDMAKEISKDDFKSYAILYRTNREGLRVKEYLRKEKISFHSRDNFNFFKGFIAKDVLDYIRVVYQDDRQAFLRIANKPYRYISKDDLRKIGLGEDISKVLLEPKKNRYALDNNRSFLKDLSLMKKTNMNKLVSYIEKVLGYEDYLISYADRTGRDEDELFEDLREMEEVASYYDNPLELLIASSIDPDEKEAKVTLSTVHGVKGLEFDKVFVINAVEGYMPHAASMEDLEEERRIFYVAITRAREELNIYSPRFIHGKERKRSRFIL